MDVDETMLDEDINMKEDKEHHANSEREAQKKGDNPAEGHDTPWIKKLLGLSKEDIENNMDNLGFVGPQLDQAEIKDLFQTVRVDSDPVASHSNNLDCLAFPEIFPRGTGGTTAERTVKLYDADYEKTRLLTSDNHSRRNTQYVFHMAQQKEFRGIKSGIYQASNTAIGNMTKKQLEQGVNADDKNLLKHVHTLMSQLPSRGSFWFYVRQKIEAMIIEYGPPTFWLTLSPGDYDDEELFEYLKKMNVDLPDLDKMNLSQLICKDPVLAGQFIHAKFKAIYDFICSDLQPLGEVIHDFGRTEYQSRLMEHMHCLFWIKDVPIIGVNTPQEVLDFIAKKICCKLPAAVDDPEMHRLVKRYQQHVCNNYCLRKRKNKGKVCRFAFPRDVRSTAVLHDLESSVAARYLSVFLPITVHFLQNVREC